MFSSTTALLIVAGIVLVALYKRIGAGWMKAIAVFILLFLVVSFVLIHLSFLYLSEGKTQAATLSCNATTTTFNGNRYPITGREMMLQTSVVEIQPWLHFLGMKSGYTWDRLDPEFSDTNHPTVRPVQLGGFSLYKATDAWMWFPIIKSAYGNGVVIPCDRRQYNILVDQAGDLSAERA